MYVVYEIFENFDVLKYVWEKIVYVLRFGGINEINILGNVVCTISLLWMALRIFLDKLQGFGKCTVDILHYLIIYVVSTVYMKFCFNNKDYIVWYF